MIRTKFILKLRWGHLACMYRRLFKLFLSLHLYRAVGVKLHQQHHPHRIWGRLGVVVDLRVEKVQRRKFSRSLIIIIIVEVINLRSFDFFWVFYNLILFNIWIYIMRVGASMQIQILFTCVCVYFFRFINFKSFSSHKI